MLMAIKEAISEIQVKKMLYVTVDVDIEEIDKVQIEITAVDDKFAGRVASVFECCLLMIFDPSRRTHGKTRDC